MVRDGGFKVDFFARCLQKAANCPSASVSSTNVSGICNNCPIAMSVSSSSTASSVPSPFYLGVGLYHHMIRSLLYGASGRGPFDTRHFCLRRTPSPHHDGAKKDEFQQYYVVLPCTDRSRRTDSYVIAVAWKPPVRPTSSACLRGHQPC